MVRRGDSPLKSVGAGERFLDALLLFASTNERDSTLFLFLAVFCILFSLLSMFSPNATTIHIVQV